MRVGAAAIAMLLLALMSITIPALSGDGGSVLAQSSNALDRYTGRSPGERGETEILKGKEPRIADWLFDLRVNSGGQAQTAQGTLIDTPADDSRKDYPHTQDPPAPTDPVSTTPFTSGTTAPAPLECQQ